MPQYILFYFTRLPAIYRMNDGMQIVKLKTTLLTVYYRGDRQIAPLLRNELCYILVLIIL